MAGRLPGGGEGHRRLRRDLQLARHLDWANGQTITQFWSANVTGSVVATNMAYNGSLGAGQSTSWGFLGSWNNSTNTNPTPSCTAS